MAVEFEEISLGANETARAAGSGEKAGATRQETAAQAAALARTTESSAVQKALDKHLDVKLKNAPLNEVAAYLADRAGVNVLLDSKAFDDAGIFHALTVTFERKDVRLGIAIREMLAEHKLAFTIPDDDVLLITTAAAVKERPVVRVYNVADLVLPSEPLREATQLGQPAGSNALVDLIERSVDPPSWPENGGSGSISMIGFDLVVSQTPSDHQKIAQLLAALKSIRADEKTGKTAAPVLLGSTPMEDAVRRCLELRQDIDFHEMPLRGVTAYLRGKGVPVTVDQKQLAGVKVKLDTRFSFSAKQVPLTFSLRRMLGRHGLDYFLRDGVVEITTRAVAMRHVRLGIYPVADLLDSIPGGREEAPDFESLKNSIVNTIAPTSWIHVGGAARFAHYANPIVLLIVQPEEIHEQIANLLSQLRSARRAAPGAGAAKLDAGGNNAMVVRVHRVMNKDDAALAQYIAVIRKTIAPKSWSDGSGYIGRVPSAIVVRNILEVQVQVHDLLKDLTAFATPPNSGGFGTPAASKQTLAPPPVPAGTRGPSVGPTQPPAIQTQRTPTKLVEADGRQGSVGSFFADSITPTAVERALDKRVSLKLSHMPLTEVAAHLADLSGVNVFLDRKGLAEAHVAAGLEIDFEMEDVRLGTAIRELLAEHDLGYAILDDNVLLITSAAAAGDHRITRVYNIQDFLSLPGPVGEFTEFPPRDEADLLVNMITANVDATSWADSGGSGTISVAAGCLVISQSPQALGKIADLLAALREVRAAKRAGKPPTLLLVGATVAEDKIRERLARRQNVDFDEISISRLADLLRAQGLPAWIDRRHLAEVSLTPETKISLKLNHVPLEFALRTMLREHELNFYVDDGLLVVTTDAAAKEHVRIGVYPVADLVQTEASDDCAEFDFDDLINVITIAVAPTSWPDTGGIGSIIPYPNPPVIVLEQSDEVHEQIADLLSRIRAARRAARESAAKTAPLAAKDEMVVRTQWIGGLAASAIDQYIAAIRNAIEPKSWLERGAFITRVPGALVIRNTPTVQARITSLLRAFQDARIPSGCGGFAPQITPQPSPRPAKPPPLSAGRTPPTAGGANAASRGPH